MSGPVPGQRFGLVTREAMARLVALPPMAARVYLALSLHADAEGACRPSRRTLGDLAGTSEEVTRKMLRALERVGLVVTDPGSGHRASRYLLPLRPPEGGPNQGGLQIGGGPDVGVRPQRRDPSDPNVGTPEHTKEQTREQTKKARGVEKAPVLRSEFELFWASYPPRDGRRDKKAEAWAEWQRLRPSPDLQATMRAALGRYRTEKPVDAVRWLKHRRWEDDVGVTAPATTRPRAMAAGGVPMLTYEESLARRQREGRA